MRRGSLRVLICVGFAVAMACGLDLAGEGGPIDGTDAEVAEGSTGLDVAQSDNETPPPDDASISDASDAGLDADATIDAPPPVTFDCAGTKVTDCATQCPTRPLRCMMCATNGGAPWRVCVPPGSSCYATYRPVGYTWCRCNPPDASTCLLPEQGCNNYDNGVCVTCGETQTQGNPCKGGGTCNQVARTCQ